MTVAGLRRRRNTRIVPDGDLGFNYNNPAEGFVSPYFQAVMQDAPDVYFRLDETGSGPFVDIANGHNATPNGTIVTQASLLSLDPDASAKFDWGAGTLQHAATTYNLSQRPLTVEAWVNPGALDGQGQGSQIIVSCGPTGGWAVEIQDADGTYTLTYETVAFYNFTSSVKAAVGVTHHIVFVLQTGNTIDFYLNGSFQQTIATAALAATTNKLCIGRKDGFANGFPRSTIDEVAIYKSALTYERIRAHYDASLYGRYGAADSRVVHRAWSGRS